MKEFTNDYSAPTKEELIALRQVAGGVNPGDVALRGGEVVFVHTGEIRKADVILKGRHIAAVTDPGRLSAEEEVDVSGKYLAPNFIEAHFHVAYSMLTPGALARLSVPKGTTAILADPNCEANILGMDGIHFVHTTKAPLRMFLQVSSSVPRTPDLEMGGYEITPEEIDDLLRQPYAVSLGEAVPFDMGDVSAEVQSMAIRNGKRINGHTARLQGEYLWRYLAGGICDDHNAANREEAWNIIRHGGCVAIQSGSMTNYLSDILKDPETFGPAASHLLFCADDKHAADIVKEGHIDHHVRTAVGLGVDPAVAIRMATLNTAAHFRIDHLIGSITPSRLADLMILPDLKDFRPETVYVGGAAVARDGEPLFENTDEIPDAFVHTIRLGADFSSDSLKIEAPKDKTTVKAKVAELYDGYYKRLKVEELEVKDGVVQTDPARDIAKVAVVDRHKGSGKAGRIFLQASGIKNGAIASCNNCENQNIIVIGSDDEQMLLAIRTIEEMQGGYVVISDGKVKDRLPLPVAGVMSSGDFKEVAADLERINASAKEIGCRIESPFLTSAFIGLAGVPDIGLTELGIIDVETQTFTEVLEEGEGNE